MGFQSSRIPFFTNSFEIDINSLYQKEFSFGLNGTPLLSCASKYLFQGRILRLLLLKLISRQKFRENFDLRETFFVSFVSCAASGSTTPRKNMSGVSIKIKDFP